ncbi:dihydrolipoyl dehydrogenase family protein [Nocardiopsis suaedae]|uniref:NAD(P)/FAD-dependent oxidoreductase n=1 Tax=Nocardiopsis suaedae TaxID=3018444 RepID=A0ABT4TS20_9ACTN|nr:NAD(P)/FAD-dependent oxidoreductase [Nocardiopsis suaedae]MDA2807064.1 NAD(P)/FAD-dependent oxidoreductase [Nocardiopsis suaedae]
MADTGTDTADVVVVGMGPGGEALAGSLAGAGMDVVGVEAALVGGECPYWGCIPTKMMVRASDALAETRRVPELAGTAEAFPDFAPVARRIRDEATTDWDDTAAVDRFLGQGGRFVRGTGRLEGADTVRVREEGGERLIRARTGVVVAAGTVPFAPPIPGLDRVPYWTNRDAVRAEKAPGSLCVIGGGPIGLEFAQAFARFGTRVSVLEAQDRLLGPEEPESGELVAGVLSREGLDVRTGVRITGVAHGPGGFAVETDHGRIEAERLLVATGRRPDLEGLGLASIGLDTSARAIPVDERMRVAPGVWALGDIVGRGEFTHVSVYQARIAAQDILTGGEGPVADYRALPRVTFTDPEVGAVGLTEDRAREQGVRVRTGTAQVPSTARGWIHEAGNDGFIKLVEDRDAGVLVGATSAGPNGGEVLGALSVAVHARTAVEVLRSMIYAYPTFHRGIEDALNDLVSGD